jgi:hypothetical protein
VSRPFGIWSSAGLNPAAPGPAGNVRRSSVLDGETMIQDAIANSVCPAVRGASSAMPHVNACPCPREERPGITIDARRRIDATLWNTPVNTRPNHGPNAPFSCPQRRRPRPAYRPYRDRGVASKHSGALAPTMRSRPDRRCRRTDPDFLIQGFRGRSSPVCPRW